MADIGDTVRSLQDGPIFLDEAHFLNERVQNIGPFFFGKGVVSKRIFFPGFTSVPMCKKSRKAEF